MSGITGWVSFQRDLTNERETVEAMTATMALRGPDDGAVWLSPHAALGHRRLVVSPSTSAPQPMTADTPDGTVTVCGDGEVYNTDELRAELRRRGHDCTTDSDTEVVLRGYLEWGPALAERLNGMYAFALWDGRTETLTLIRDRMGIKPLYYTPTDDGILFGSEPKAILANPLAEPVVTTDGLREMFNGFLRTPGHAVWAGMYEVEPGHLLTLDRHGRRDHTYWQLEAKEHHDDLDTTVGHIRELLTDAITRQLTGDAPRCVLLSGGLDSSSLTGLSARILGASGERVHTYSVDFVGQAENFQAQIQLGRPTQDLPYCHDVAAHVGTDHHDVVLDHDMISSAEVREACVRARDLPVGLGDRDYSVYLLFKQLREHSPLALSGDASDAVFASYPTVHDRQVGKSDSPTPGLLEFPVEDTGLLDRGFLDDIDRKGYLRQRYQEAVDSAPTLPGEGEKERQMRLYCYLDLMRMVPQVLADRRDRLGMAAGVEVRVPYYDHRLIEYVFNTPFDMKTFDGREKSLLRAAAKDVLPQSVYEREKSGYPSPHDPYYVSLIQRQAGELVAGDHPALEFYDSALVAEAVGAEPRQVTNSQRCGMERLLDIATWLDLYHPTIKSAP